MATFEDVLQSAMRHAESVQSMFGDSGVLDSIQESQRLVGQARENAEWVDQMMENARLSADTWAELRWPPPWHLPARVLDQIAAVYRKKKISPDEVAEILIKHHTPNKIAEFGDRWRGYAWLGPRLPIFLEALASYVDGRHYSTVCTLLPQFEGVLRELLGNKAIEENSIGTAGKIGFGSAAGRFYAQVIREQFWPTSGSPIPELSRHSILHGNATDYGTAKHSLRVILIADIILSSVNDSREEPEEASSASEITISPRA